MAPGAWGSSRAGLFVFEYYDAKKVKMTKTVFKRWCAFSILRMHHKTLLHQLLGLKPASQWPEEAQ